MSRSPRWLAIALLLARALDVDTLPDTQLPAVVMTLNQAYVPVWANFIAAPGARFLERWEVHLLCTDRGTGPIVAKHGWTCRATSIGGGRGAAAVYTKRIPYLIKLVGEGRDVLVSDIDAIWLRDPLPELESIQAGIVSSRGSSPPGVARSWGSTFCMGFIFFRGSDPRVRAALQVGTRPMHEDQTDFNQNIMRANVQWDEGRLKYIESTATAYGTMVAHGKPYTGLRIAMLAHSRFMRICPRNHNFGNVTIAHCHSRGKQQYLKIKKLRSLGLWYLDKTTTTGGANATTSPAPAPARPTAAPGRLGGSNFSSAQ